MGINEEFSLAYLDVIDGKGKRILIALERCSFSMNRLFTFLTNSEICFSNYLTHLTGKEDLTITKQI